MTDNITPLFGGENTAASSPLPDQPQPRLYNIFRTGVAEPLEAFGHLSVGSVTAVLEELDDPRTIVFMALTSSLDYVIEADTDDDVDDE